MTFRSQLKCLSATRERQYTAKSTKRDRDSRCFPQRACSRSLHRLSTAPVTGLLRGIAGKGGGRRGSFSEDGILKLFTIIALKCSTRGIKNSRKLITWFSRLNRHFYTTIILLPTGEIIKFAFHLIQLKLCDVSTPG